jgi:DNA-binding NarL/FixJ family response regulator
MVTRLRIFLADDHAIIRQGLKLLIDSQPDMEVIGETADGHGVLQQANV